MTEDKRSGTVREKLRTYLKKGDIAVIAVLFALSLALGAASLISERTQKGAARYAVITLGGEEIARLPLDEDTVYVVSGGDARCVIEISGGEARVSDANCPDRLCVASGAISRSGQLIVCLPNKTVVTIETEDGGGVDSTAY